MKNKLAITLLVCLLGEGAAAQEQEPELRWGKFGFYSNWRRESDKPGDDNTIRGIHGRQEAWTNYYPSVEWSGILDEGGFLILNHDPWRLGAIARKRRFKTVNEASSDFGAVTRCMGKMPMSPTTP